MKKRSLKQRKELEDDEVSGNIKVKIRGTKKPKLNDTRLS